MKKYILPIAIIPLGWLSIILAYPSMIDYIKKSTTTVSETHLVSTSPDGKHQIYWINYERSNGLMGKYCSDSLALVPSNAFYDQAFDSNTNIYRGYCSFRYAKANWTSSTNVEIELSWDNTSDSNTFNAVFETMDSTKKINIKYIIGK